MRISFDTLTQIAFGLKPVVLAVVPQESQATPSTMMETRPLPEAEAVSLLGTPVYETFTILPGTTASGVQYDGYTFPFTTVMDYSRRKKIVETTVAGRDSDVVEIISTTDYLFSFRGLLVSRDGGLPVEEVAALERICAVQDSVEVRGRLFNALGVDRILILSHDVRSVDGYLGVRRFTIDARSIKALEVAVRDGL